MLKVGNKKPMATYYKSKSDNNETVRLPLSEAQSERDLGIIVDSNLNFKDHVTQMTAKANRIVGIIRRSFDFLSEKLFVQLFKTLVRPVLEYGHVIWQPYNKTQCAEIEDVQRRATKLLSSLRDKEYPERLVALRLPSLEYRRMRGDIIDLYKYIHGFYKTATPLFQLSTVLNTRGNSYKLAKDQSTRLVRSNFFSVRVVNTWNALPEYVVSAPSVNALKTRLDEHWAFLPSKFEPECYS